MLSEEQPRITLQGTGSLPHGPSAPRQDRTHTRAAAQPTNPTGDVPLAPGTTGPQPNPEDAGGSCSAGMV